MTRFISACRYLLVVPVIGCVLVVAALAYFVSQGGKNADPVEK